MSEWLFITNIIFGETNQRLQHCFCKDFKKLNGFKVPLDQCLNKQ